MAEDLAYFVWEAADRFIPNARLTHISSGGNEVYRLVDNDGRSYYLRLTSPHMRRYEENVAECQFVVYLFEQGVPVARPIKSPNGHFVEPVMQAGQTWSASLFVEAPGVLVKAGGVHWHEPFFRAWGRVLGEMHKAAMGYEGDGRWQWYEELWLAQADRLIPLDDTASRRELDVVLNHFDQLAKTGDTYGMNHGDFAPGNFLFDPAQGITIIDFGNCGQHWFMWDITISLSVILWLPDMKRNRIRHWLLRSYEAVLPIAPKMLAELDWFLRLRMIYVYLSRLWWFGERPSSHQQVILNRLQALVHHPITWENVHTPTWRI